MQTLEAELTHSERLASIGRLAAGVAHEIGNPVTGIACIAQNLQQDDDPELLREGLEEILEQTRRIDDIVQSLSSFSRGGFSTGERFSQFDLHQCLQDARRLVQLSREGKHLDIGVPAGQGLVIEGDRQRLLQVFVNLLSNACDASDPGGLIEMDTRVGRAGVQVTVRDHGHGIPPSTLEKVLEPFFTTKEPGRGTGLGLPLAHKILQDHGGQLAIESDSGGTRVTVTLPLQQPGKASVNVHEYTHVENSDHRG
jgi:signal transduction histidine kinase